MTLSSDCSSTHKHFRLDMAVHILMVCGVLDAALVPCRLKQGLNAVTSLLAVQNFSGYLFSIDDLVLRRLLLESYDSPFRSEGILQILVDRFMYLTFENLHLFDVWCKG